jgi:hypothetical protein
MRQTNSGTPRKNKKVDKRPRSLDVDAYQQTDGHTDTEL